MDRCSLGCLLALFFFSGAPTAADVGLTAWKASPAGDPLEGQAETTLYCNASGVLSGTGHRIVWEVPHSVQSAGNFDVRPGPSPSADVLASTLVIRNISRADGGYYTCRLLLEARGETLASRSVVLAVAYFPAVGTSPACSPDGAFTASPGATVELACSSEPGHPLVLFRFGTSVPLDPWTIDAGISDESRRVYGTRVTAGPETAGAWFTCTIVSLSAFPGRESSCVMGPMAVAQAEATTTTAAIDSSSGPTEETTSGPKEQTTSGPTEQTTSGPTDHTTRGPTETPAGPSTAARSSAQVPWIVACAVLAGMLLLAIAGGAVFFAQRRRRRRRGSETGSQSARPAPSDGLEDDGLYLDARSSPPDHAASPEEGQYDTIDESMQQNWEYAYADTGI